MTYNVFGGTLNLAQSNLSNSLPTQLRESDIKLGHFNGQSERIYLVTDSCSA